MSTAKVSPSYQAFLDARSAFDRSGLLSHPPHGTFKGKNFVTPDVIGYAFCRPLRCWVELAWGPGMGHDAIFGVTFRRPNNVRPETDPSCCVYNFAEALELARSGGVDTGSNSEVHS